MHMWQRLLWMRCVCACVCMCQHVYQCACVRECACVTKRVFLKVLIDNRTDDIASQQFCQHRQFCGFHITVLASVNVSIFSKRERRKSSAVIRRLTLCVHRDTPAGFASQLCVHAFRLLPATKLLMQVNFFTVDIDPCLVKVYPRSSSHSRRPPPPLLPSPRSNHIILCPPGLTVRTRVDWIGRCSCLVHFVQVSDRRYCTTAFTNKCGSLLSWYIYIFVFNSIIGYLS